MNRIEVLIVDNDRQLLIQAYHLFKQLGYHADLANNDTDALKLAAVNNYNLIITSLDLPLNIPIFIHSMRSLKQRKRQPLSYICGLTSHIIKKQAQPYFAIGFNAIIPKPLNGHALVNILCKAKLQLRKAS